MKARIPTKVKRTTSTAFELRGRKVSEDDPKAKSRAKSRANALACLT